MSNPCPMGIVDFLMEILTKTNERTSPCPNGPRPIRKGEGAEEEEEEDVFLKSV